MPITGKLTALKVVREKRPDMYGDGGGLYLQVSESGSKSWVFRFWVAERDPTTGKVARDLATNRLKGRSREMGLGSFATVSLAEARDRALECRKLREKDIDPIEAREAARREAALQRAKSLKFKDAAEAYMAAHRVAWKNDKHAAEWQATLKTYAYPIIGELPLQLIDTTLVMKVIEPLWSEKPETASLLRGRIESVLDWATVRGYRQDENPARWRGHLDQLLPAHLLRDDLAALLRDRSVPIVLIKANVWRLLAHRLTEDGFNVINGDRVVYFPGSGRQKDFQRQFSEIMKLQR